MNRNLQHLRDGVAIPTGKKLVVITLAGLLWISPIIGDGISITGSAHSSFASADSASVKKLGEEIITSGAILNKYQLSTTRSGKKVTALADVIRIDLQNSNVKLDAMNGVNGQYTTRQSTQGMANEN